MIACQVYWREFYIADDRTFEEATHRERERFVELFKACNQIEREKPWIIEQARFN